MPIASVVVYVRPERLAAVRDALCGLAGVEVHLAAPEGRLVATIEAEDAARVADRLLQIHRLEGVLASPMVYCQDDPEEASP